MQTDHVEARVSQLTPLFTKTDDCDCPAGRGRWIAFPCAGTILGRVFDRHTGEGVENVEVWICGSQTGEYEFTTTNSLGFYKISSLETGAEYIVSVRGENYSQNSVYGVELFPAGTVQSIDTVRTGVVMGKITGPLGEPISGAEVSFGQLDSPELGGDSVVTNENGEFCTCSLDTISTLSFNGTNYQVIVVHPSYSCVLSQVFVSPYYGKGDETTLNLQMASRATITGVVTSNGAPVVDAAVWLAESFTQVPVDEPMTLSNSDGYFSLSVNAPDTCIISAMTDQSGSISYQVTVSPGSESSVGFDLPGPGIVSGIVTDLTENVIEGATVSVTSADHNVTFSQPSITDSGGKYTIAGVAPYDGYTVFVQMPQAVIETYYVALENVSVEANLISQVDLQGDTIPPTINIVSPESGQTVSGLVQFSAQISDNQGIFSVALRVNDEEVDYKQVSDLASSIIAQQENISLQWDSSGYSSGSYVAEIIVWDIAGNEVASVVTLNKVQEGS